MISNYFCEYDSSGYVCINVMFYFHRICKCWIHGKEDTDQKDGNGELMAKGEGNDLQVFTVVLVIRLLLKIAC